MDPDQARQNVGPDLDPNCLTLRHVFLKEKKDFEKIQQTAKSMKKFQGSKVLNMHVQLVSGAIVQEVVKGELL